MASQSELGGIFSIMERLASLAGRVSRFSYTQDAFDNDQIEGSELYDFTQGQNIPLLNLEVTGLNSIDTDYVLVEKGIRAQGASISRGFQNHFTGRVSYNLNKVVDKLVLLIAFLTAFFSHNANEYDPAVAYKQGDVVYLVTTFGGQVLYQWFQKAVVDERPGIPPTAEHYWYRMREYTSMPRPLVNSIDTDLNDIIRPGMYSCFAGDTLISVKNMPPVPEVFSGSFILTVKSDLASERIIIQEVHYRDTALEYTRSFSRELDENDNLVFTLRQGWYKSRDPRGLEIVGVPGVWAFRVDPDGHLRLFYNQEPAPTGTKIVRAGDPLLATNPELLGHLIWDYTKISPNTPVKLHGPLTLPSNFMPVAGATPQGMIETDNGLFKFSVANGSDPLVPTSYSIRGTPLAPDYVFKTDDYIQIVFTLNITSPTPTYPYPSIFDVLPNATNYFEVANFIDNIYFKVLEVSDFNKQVVLEISYVA